MDVRGSKSTFRNRPKYGTNWQNLGRIAHLNPESQTCEANVQCMGMRAVPKCVVQKHIITCRFVIVKCLWVLLITWIIESCRTRKQKNTNKNQLRSFLMGFLPHKALKNKSLISQVFHRSHWVGWFYSLKKVFIFIFWSCSFSISFLKSSGSLPLFLQNHLGFI